jgi:hypothetical protein
MWERADREQPNIGNDSFGWDCVAMINFLKPNPPASNYRNFQLQTGTALEQTGDNWNFGVLPNGDLVGIKKSGTGTGKAEVHILTAESNYQSFRLQTGTALEPTGDNWNFGVLPNGDLVGIKKSGTGTGKTEVHILAAQ